MIMDPTPEKSGGDKASPERILTASPYLFCELDRNGRIHRLNAVAEAQFGYSSEALNGTGLLDLVHPDERQSARDAIASAGPAARAPVRLRCQTARGTYRRMEWEFSFDGTSGHVLSWGQDISEAMAIREELGARIEILNDLLDTRTRQLGQLLTVIEDGSRRTRLPRSGSRTGAASSSPSSGSASSEDDAGTLPARHRRTLDRTFFDRIPTGVLRVSTDQRILRMNREMKTLLGGHDSAEGLVGSSLPGEILRGRGEFRRLQERLEHDGKARDLIAHLRRPDGRILRALIDAVRVQGDGGEHEFDELYVRPDLVGAPSDRSTSIPVRRSSGEAPRARIRNMGAPREKESA